ncbi:hypothetical protein SAY87_012437 [Trapa incisa]|uniref:Uncharacterized protein n=1 Tax=Trapa incisa TaxID=236973 RepID=A0AAN7JJS1_9MYRT|nr:hypothetical protein SAY87_012437 [Trapa incisa]
MGGVCSGGTPKPKREKVAVSRSVQSVYKTPKESSPASESKGGDYRETPPKFDSGEVGRLSFNRELKLSKPSTPLRKVSGKATGKGSFLGRAGTVSLDRAVDVLDMLGSSVSNLNASGGFISGITSRGSKLSILAFEVANTIVKGSNLLQSLSEENIQFLKKDILQSKGVQLLVTSDMKELLSIAASDKREELDIFSREVIRFGNLCKDPQWHNLDRFFSRLDSEDGGQQQLKAEAEMTMQELSSLAQYTSDLYHELHNLDRFEHDYMQRREEAELLNLPRKGESLTMMLTEVKHQKKLVQSLKKKSLWSKNLEEIIEKLVEVVTYIHQEISNIFRDNDNKVMTNYDKEENCPPQRLGVMGLALHYANIINLMDTIASRPAYLPPNTRDTLYHGLPANVKNALRNCLQANGSTEELSIPKLKAGMEKTLKWLVPVAANTVKIHQGFGWVGEWANTGNELGNGTPSSTNLIRLQTLYHADKQKTDRYILQLVTWLHRLFSLMRHRDDSTVKPLAFYQSPVIVKRLSFHSDLIAPSSDSTTGKKTQLSEEDREMLNRAYGKKSVPGISKSQELPRDIRTRRNRVFALSRSTGSSPNREFSMRRESLCTNINILDVMDGIDTATI